MVMQLVSKRALDSPAIPDRLYFKIGDVARLCEVETYVLRFWETQFPPVSYTHLPALFTPTAPSFR